MELTFKHFENMEIIDHQYFPDENITSAVESYNWYKADPNSCIAVKENNIVAAYITILSLKKEIFEKVKTNKLNESEIVVEDLELRKECYYNYLYFSSIAIEKKHKTIKILKRLMDNAKSHIRKILNQNHNIIEVMADCSTEEGVKMAQHILKLKPYIKTSHGSTIHTLDGATFLKNFEIN